MSIWSSVPGKDIYALDGHDEEANYRAEGEPTIQIDVATTGAHDHIRLALWGAVSSAATRDLDVCTVLAPSAARALRDALDTALRRQER